MSIVTTFVLALRALWRNKVRTMLTMLGIIVGIGCVIAMVSSGQGAQQAVKEVFQSMGTNVLVLTNQSSRGGPSVGAGGSSATITWDDVKRLSEPGTVPTIRVAAPVLSARTQLISDAGNWNTSVLGTTADWFEIRNWKAAQGVVLDADTGGSNTKIAVIGQTIAIQLFGDSASGVGQSVRINGQPYEVVGILEKKGQGPMGDNDDTVIIPLKTYQQKLEKQGVAKYMRGQLLISMTGDDLAEQTIADITALLREWHKLDAAAEDDFRIRNPAEFAKAQQDSTERISTLLALVAAASLFVGGIGVMNIMLVSVIERTREIGIRMGVGAKPMDILTQFLVESLVLSIVGGILGLAFGYVCAWKMSDVFGWKLFFPMDTAIIAFAVSGAVGVGFGLYPAIRASRLDPITALRYES